jgi:hypothetical protein
MHSLIPRPLSPVRCVPLQARFSQFARWHMAAAYELRAQRHHFVGAAYWLVLTLVRTLKGLIRVNARCADSVPVLTPSSLLK